MNIYALGTIFVQLTLGMNAYVTAQGNAKMAMLTVMQFAMLPMQGIGQGAQPITSYNYGARNAERVKKTFRLLRGTCLSYSVLVGTAVLLLPKTFAGVFCADATLLDFTAKALRIYMAGMVIFGIQIACQMTFVSIGNALCSIIVAVVRKFALLLPLICIVPRFAADKTMAVYLAEPIADVIAVTFTMVLFTVQFKKAIKKLQNNQ